MQSSTRSRSADPRPARTQAAIFAAVEELAAEPDGDMSVNAILRASGVSRSGFYAHFTGLDDLLVAMFSAAYRDIASTYTATSALHPARAARRAQEEVVAFINERRAFIRSSLDWPVGSRAHENVTEAYAEGIRAAVQVRKDAAPAGVDVDDLSLFIAGGAVAMLTKWIREDDDTIPQDVVVDRLLSVMPAWLIGSD